LKVQKKLENLISTQKGLAYPTKKEFRFYAFSHNQAIDNLD